jgi:hypothetical protein
MQQELKGGTGGGFATGTICTDTNLYKCTDNKVEYIEHIAAGSPFPNFPGGNGKGRATWFKITLATDGDRSGFDAVKVAAGTL